MSTETTEPAAKIRVPWTVDQVRSLNAYQRSGAVHPYTCPQRDPATHPIVNGDRGILTATVHGWYCRWCRYSQTWAHRSTAEWDWPGAPAPDQAGDGR